MSMDRRGFLKMAGVASLAGVAGGKVIEAAASTAKGEYRAKGGALHAERWAMVIDTRKCLEQHDCTRCMDACHVAHNVPSFDNDKDSISWLWREPFHGAFPNQHNEHAAHDMNHKEVLVLCNHCDNPPCVRACPTQTTWAREDGIVMMDMHRCIGCRYCITACPYGARSFNWRDPRTHIADLNDDFPSRTRGVVEKCNFCAERLATGQQPYCAEACEHGAMVFGDLEDPTSEVRQLLHDNFTIRRKPGLGTQPQIYYIV
jgi:Fe-S-cluster-containing dehydrogenase component